MLFQLFMTFALQVFSDICNHQKLDSGRTRQDHKAFDKPNFFGTFQCICN